MTNVTFKRQQFYDLIWSEPTTRIFEKYAISYSSLKKICKDMDIPMPRAGHWEKIKHRKEIFVEPLPTEFTGVDEITLAFKGEGENPNLTLSPLSILQKEIENTGKLIVQKELTNPDKLIVQARNLLTEKRRYESSDGIVNTYGQSLSIRVMKDNVNRALRFMDAFVKTIKKRGHFIEFENHTSFLIVHGEKIEFYLREKLKRVPRESKTSWQQYDKVPTGKLAFNVKISWQISEWKDGKFTLEHQLDKIIASLEISGEKLRQERIAREKHWAENRAKERIEKEKQKLEELEVEKFKRLLNDSKHWQECIVLRDYLKAIEQMARKDGQLSEEVRKWLIWARQKTDLYDPLLKF